MSRLSWDGNSVLLTLSGVLNTHTLDDCLKSFPLPNATPSAIILDMTNIRQVKPGGVGQVVSLLSWLSASSGSQIAPLDILGLSEPVASFLATLGVFSVLRSRAGLRDSEGLLHLEEQRRDRRKARDRTRPVGVRATHAAAPVVVMPLEVIPKSPSSRFPAARADFDASCRRFVNQAADKFEFMFQSGFLGELADPQQFWHANVELYKNVFDHSESWGLGIVCASANPSIRGAVVSYHDIGIGIPASVSRAVQNASLQMDDEAAIRWAIQERNSSKPGNDGLGLSIVADLVRTLNGRIEIRSGICRLTGDGSEEAWTAEQVPLLPGTHVSFFIPVAS